MKFNYLKKLFVLGLCAGLTSSCINDDDYVIPTVNEYVYTDGFEGDWNNWSKFSTLGAQEWQLDTQYGNPGNCAKMSGYAGSNNVNEDWLISPEINLSGVSSASLSFQTASKFSGNLLEVKISSDYSGGNPAAATWTNLTGTLDTNTGAYVWTNSGQIDISAFAGGTACIAFKYTSTASASTTWEVDNIKITKN